MKAAFLILAFVALSSTLYCEATEVSRSPKIVNQADLNHSEGTNATLMCSIGSGELEGLTYEWLKDDKKILPSSRYRVSIAPENFNSILRVIDLVPEDSGTYSCVARNSFGKDRISIKLQVKVQLKWIVEPKGALKVSVGKPLHIPCAADGQPAPRIVWTKLDNGAPSRTLGAELRFNALGQGDSGVYECRATNDAEEDLVATVEVNVLVSQSPTLVDPVERLNHPEGTNATFTCSIGSGDLSGLTFEWFRDERKLSPSNKYKIVVLPDNVNSILRVIDLRPEDSAIYSCLARNRFGQDRISTKLMVKVQLKWLIEPKRELELAAGRPLHVPCSATGQPAPKIEWTRLGGSELGERSFGSELRINAVSQDDAGLYECRAKNGAEKDLVARMKLSVLGK